MTAVLLALAGGFCVGVGGPGWQLLGALLLVAAGTEAVRDDATGERHPRGR